MKTLGLNWFAEGTIDFEYKQYILLAYLEEVKRYYAAQKVYPVLSDLITHYRNLEAYRNSKKNMAQHFPHRITQIDLVHRQLIYEPELVENETLQEIDHIVEYALPQIKAQVEQGKELYESIEAKIQVIPVGLIPLYKNEGYVLIRMANDDQIYIYRFTSHRFNYGNEKMQAIHTHFVENVTQSLTTDFDTIKINLIKKYQDLPNPATYAFESAVAVPMEETLLPIAKRKLLKIIVNPT